jgi:hypothetical protein
MTNELEMTWTEVVVAKQRYCPVICLDGMRKNCEKVRIADDPPKV